MGGGEGEGGREGSVGEVVVRDDGGDEGRGRSGGDWERDGGGFWWWWIVGEGDGGEGG